MSRSKDFKSFSRENPKIKPFLKILIKSDLTSEISFPLINENILKPVIFSIVFTISGGS
jgi:hypothetical protein